MAPYNTLGQQVSTLHDGPMQPSDQSFTLDGTALSSGLYFVRATGDAFTNTQRVVLVK